VVARTVAVCPFDVREKGFLLHCLQSCKSVTTCLDMLEDMKQASVQEFSQETR